MNLTLRAFKNEDDYWRMREFLRQVMVLNGLRELSWHVARLDYWWWFANPHLEKFDPQESIFLWEAKDGRLAAALNPEGHGQAFLQIHPEFAAPKLLEEMIAVAEERLAVPTEEGGCKVWNMPVQGK